MQRLWNDGWEFSRQPLHTTFDEMQERKETYKPVGLPHDWLIYQAKDLYQDGTGWYRKSFRWRKNSEKLIYLRFDGIYMDSKIFVNGCQVFEWKYGYSAFDVELTPYLKEGDNEISVSVDFQAPNSRWYSGAGIFRNVWIKELPKKHLCSDGIYFHAEKSEGTTWKVQIDTEIAGRSTEASENVKVTYELCDRKGELIQILQGNVSQIMQEERGEQSLEDQEDIICLRLLTEVSDPKLWDVVHPNCYLLKVKLWCGDTLLQCAEIIVGFRMLQFDPNKGFLLNGVKCKLNGVCEHHDLGCLGSAYHTQAMRRKLEILKNMGVNAIRLTHNMHAEDVLALADEMGILLVSEAFDMWESPKTTYDYARFFPQWYKKDVKSWVKRDRNHPSVIMWSIGNEIYDTHSSDRGQMWTRLLQKEVRKYDPAQNAAVTIGSNYMPWENARHCADIVKVAGYNYGEAYYENHHREHPDWIIYGSETASTVQSRGIYHFPYQQSVLADEDEQCSALGNSTTSWGAKSSEYCIMAERDHEYSCGQFLWTGFDYIGEPTPYHTRNSYFGQIDTAGFPKDSYYIYQAEWTDYRTNPMVHIFPYWDFNEGQLIDIRVCSNAPVVELLFNGKSQGTFGINHRKGEQLVGHWQLPYTKGEICALACDENGKIVAREVRHSFGDAARIILKASKNSLKADGNDLLFLEISMEDKDGYPVENANNRITVQTEGPGALAGLDNGDSTDQDEYKCSSRRLFSGKLLAVLKSGTSAGTLKITVRSGNLPDAILEVPVHPAEVVCGSSPIAYLFEPEQRKEGELPLDQTDIPVRNIKLISSRGLHLHEKNPETFVSARLCPDQAADQSVIWSVVDDAGIPSKLATIEPDGQTVKVTARSDGQFRLRCMSRCQSDKVRMISQLEFQISGLGKAYMDPYEFVSAGIYDYSRGEVGNGNEHGVATARAGETQVGFHQIDFGTYGSDEICLPIFALTDEPYRIQIYEGMPGEENADLLADVIYEKPSVWNVYQEETYQLKKRLKGITSICFVLQKKIHLKGFCFTRQTRAWETMTAASCDQIYGDSFQKEESWIRGIGNNVTIEFTDLDFGDAGATKVTICGSTPLSKNTIMLRILNQDGTEETRQVLEFRQEQSEQTFCLQPITGKKIISFVFLPGCDFDFSWVRFEKN
ncbi:MAG: glycoside hydrolase family 2 TIM barrel-domain containing protein [Lachnospiraceae bacterium]|nr:glycoside hydrolase family 2 TIM barrel-domain containing protein [Lachnospiraceae bacterium]